MMLGEHISREFDQLMEEGVIFVSTKKRYSYLEGYFKLKYRAYCEANFKYLVYFLN